MMMMMMYYISDASDDVYVNDTFSAMLEMSAKYDSDANDCDSNVGPSIVCEFITRYS
jgi:hypothetical protein